MPVGTLNRYIAGRDMKAAGLTALAGACDVSLEWLALGRGPMRRPTGQQLLQDQAPLYPPPKHQELDVNVLAKCIEIVDAILETSGRSWTNAQRAVRIANSYQLMMTPEDQLPPLPQLPPRSGSDY